MLCRRRVQFPAEPSAKEQQCQHETGRVDDIRETREDEILCMLFLSYESLCHEGCVRLHRPLASTD